MLKGVGKLNNYLTKWCRSHGFNVTCKLSTDFSCGMESNTIYYALVIPEEHADKFSQLCSVLLNDTSNIFILSFFHELGHLYSEEKVAGKDSTNRVDKYYNSEIEYSATVWACKYINEHSEEVNKMYNEFMELVYTFYNENGVTND